MSASQDAIDRALKHKAVARAARVRARHRKQLRCHHLWGPEVGTVRTCGKCQAQLVTRASEAICDAD